MTEIQERPPATDLSVKTVDEKGKAPKRRIPTTAAALSAYQRAKQFDTQRDNRFAAFEGIYMGFPPVDPAEMEKAGMGDMPNVNTKEFQYRVDAYASNWRSIHSNGSQFAEVELLDDDPMRAREKSKYVTLAFNNAIKQWDRPGFMNASHYAMKSSARDVQMALYGIGVNLWRDPIDWRWDIIPTRKVLVPVKTLVSLENCPVMFIEDQMSVTELWERRKMKGWNENAVCYALYLRTNQRGPDSGQWWSYAEWLSYVRENSTWTYDSDFAPVRFTHVYVEEFTDDANKGKITHGIVIDAQPFQFENLKDREKAQKPEKADGWLYEKENEAQYWSQVVSVFADNSGPEMTWHGVKGFGDLIYDMCHFNNLMFNRTAMSAIISNMPIFTSSGESERQRLNQVKFAFGAILYPDLGQLNQLKIGGDIKGAMEMFRMGRNVLNTETRIFPQNDTTEGGEKPTARQVTFDRMDEEKFTGLQVANYRATGLDATFGEMYRRIAQPGSKYPESWPGGKVAKQFREECAKYGIKESELLKIKNVRASRNTSSGNIAIDVAKGKELLAIATPGQGQLNVRKYMADSLVGCDMTPAFIEEQSPPPNYEDVQIDQENLDIQSGQTPRAFGWQPHDKHLGLIDSESGHLQVMSSIEQVANGMLQTGIQPQVLEDAVKLHRSLDAGIGHCNQHVEFMASMPRNGSRPSLYEAQVKELRMVLNTMSQFSQAFAKAIAKVQQETQAQQASMNPELLKAQAEIAMKREMHELDKQIKMESSEMKLGSLAMRTEAQTQMKVASHEQQLGLEAEKRAFELESKRAEHQQQLIAQGAEAALNINTQQAVSDEKIRQAQEEAAAKKEPEKEPTK